MFKFKNGQKVKYKILGTIGIVISRLDHKEEIENEYKITFSDSTGRPCEWWLPESEIVAIDE